MLEVVNLFREQGTVDDLGIGTIRDALSDSLFPGTSVLHTRLRYVLFIPWLMQWAAQRKSTPADMAAEFSKLEYRLIESLLNGNEARGVIGGFARNRLKQLPSSAYWSALDAFGIRTRDFSIDGYFRRQYDHRRLANRTVPTDDPEARRRPVDTGIDLNLPQPPNDLLKTATFALTADEEQYLSDRIATFTKNSMLSWLVANPPRNDASYVWEIDNLSEAPTQLRDLVDHARRFHVSIHGAALLYNLLLARKSGRPEAIADFEERISQWREELHVTGALEGWNRQDWWATIRRQNPRIRELTQTFFNRWLDLIEKDDDVAEDPLTCDLVSTRERQIKGGRARLVNQAALDRWSGQVGLGRHEFRWSIAKGHLNDLYRARDAA